MNENERKVMFSEVYELLDIIGENFTDELSLGTGSNVDFQKVKNCYLQMIDYIITDETENNSLKTWLDNSDFLVAPASTKFHGNFKGGLSLHTLMVIKQSLIFTRPLLENFYQSPNATKFEVTTKDVFLASLCHDFCKTNFYGVEYRNAKDINGNWIRQPFYKSKNDNRNLGHGNESVLIMLEIFPSMIKNRTLIEAVSRHMGFCDLTESETYNYSNFLQNPLVILLQLADQSAANWYDF